MLIFLLVPGAFLDGVEVITPRHVVAEVELMAEEVVEAPDALVVDAVFRAPSGAVLRVPAFWAGGSTWKARYASGELGVHAFHTETPGRPIPGLDGVRGAVEVRAYRGTNPLYRHGPIQVSKDRRHFEHADGAPFFWLGDTWWMGLSARLTWPSGFQALAADRKSKGFSLIQIVGGLPPDMAPLDPRGAGDGGQAWTEGFGAIRPEFYNAADRRIQYLVEEGLVPCIVAAWKDYLPVMGVEKMKRHWRNLVARYGAYPVMWVVGGEINRTRANPRFLGGGEPAMSDDPDVYRAAWTEVARYLQAIDPFGRVVGAHNQGDFHVVDNPEVLDMYFLQTGHSALFSMSTQTEWFEALYPAEHRAPLVLSEANYQGLFDEASYWNQLQRHQFWVTFLEGGAGHTYGGNGIWQVNQPGKPFGPSPHGFVWGDTPWPRAMAHLASDQLGYGKAFLQASDWRQMAPASEGVRFDAIDLPDFSETGAGWIWPEAGTTGLVAMGTSIKLPAEGTIRRAVLRIACDAPYELSVNRQMVHRIFKLDVSDSLRHTPYWEFPLLGEYLTPGRNILRLRFEGEDFAKGDGLAAHVYVEMADGSVEKVVSDRRWRWTQPDSGWPGAFLQLDPDHGWPRVVNVKAGDSLPESGAFRQFRTYGPRCAAIPGEQWLVYTPAALPVVVSDLPANRALELVRFNPRTGEAHAPEGVRTGRAGAWTWTPPETHGDWVLRLRK